MSSPDTNWFSIIKDDDDNKNPTNEKNTKQTKLPDELVESATVAVDKDGNPINAEKFFNRKPQKAKPASADEIKPNSKQEKLF
mgnify:FL=1|tara:strand:- start:168 stop:416 length:249 start_codon:yes stop_codon:yes gene_type:complete